MADDAISTGTVDGVEPSILVKLLNVVENPHSVMVSVDKWIHKEFETPVLLTSEELSKLGGFAVEVVDDVEKDISAPVTAPETKIETSVNNPYSGQNAPVVGVTIPDKTNPPTGQ